MLAEEERDAACMRMFGNPHGPNRRALPWRAAVIVRMAEVELLGHMLDHLRGLPRGHEHAQRLCTALSQLVYTGMGHRFMINLGTVSAHIVDMGLDQFPPGGDPADTHALVVKPSSIEPVFAAEVQRMATFDEVGEALVPAPGGPWLRVAEAHHLAVAWLAADGDLSAHVRWARADGQLFTHGVMVPSGMIHVAPTPRQLPPLPTPTVALSTLRVLRGAVEAPAAAPAPTSM